MYTQRGGTSTHKGEEGEVTHKRGEGGGIARIVLYKEEEEGRQRGEVHTEGDCYVLCTKGLEAHGTYGEEGEHGGNRKVFEI